MQYKPNILVCGVERGDEVFIPNGNFRLKDNDKLTIIGTPKNTAAFFNKIGLITHQVKNAMIVGGGTIGAISSAMLPVRTVDIGVPLLAMHSSRETMGVKDYESLVDFIGAYFSL